MKKLNIYLNIELIRMIFFVLSGLLLLFLFFDFIAQLNEVGKEGYRLSDVIIYLILRIPTRIYELMPIAVLIGTIFALSLLNNQSEIVIIRTAGVALSQMMAWIAQTGVLCAMLVFLLGEYIVPLSAKLAEQWKLQSTKSVAVDRFNSGIWIKDKQAIINVQAMLPDMTLQGVRIYRFDHAKRLMEICDVEKGIYGGNNRWELINNKETHFLPNYAGIQLKSTPKRIWQTDISPEILSVLLVTPDQMSIFTLYHYIIHLKKNNQKLNQYEIAFWSKLFYPFISIAMMIIALPFSFTHRRSGHGGVKIFIGIMIGLGFHFFSKFTSYMAQLYNWAAIFAVLLPLLLFLSMSIYLILRQEKR